MIITHLQNEINHLVFLYFTSIGVLQRDYNSPDIKKIMADLQDEINLCFKRIKKYSEMNFKEVGVDCRAIAVLEYAKDYLEEGYEFLDWLIDLK